MKTLFLAVTRQLKELDIFRHIDMEKGQLDTRGMRPPVVFPCALVKTSFTFEEYGGGIKNRVGQVRIRVAFDQPASRTSSETDEWTRGLSLNYIVKAEQVFEAFRKFETPEYSAFETREFVQEDRSDGLVVMRMTFQTNRIDV